MTNNFSSKSGYASYENVTLSSTGSFLTAYSLNSSVGDIITLNVTAETNHVGATGYFEKFYVPQEVTFNPGNDPYWDSTNRWYYGTHIEGLHFNQNAQVDIMWSDNPVPPYIGPTNLDASIIEEEDDFTPDANSKYIVVEISEENTNSNEFKGWQGDDLGYSDPGGLITVEEIRNYGTTGQKSGVSHNVGAQEIQIGGRNGHLNSVYYPGILVRNDNGHFMNGSAYTVSAVANEGWGFTSWDVKHLNTTSEAERLGTPAGEVQLVGGALDNPTDLTLLVTDHSAYITVKAGFVDVRPGADNPGSVHKYILENCECVSDGGSALGDFDTLQECEDWKEEATFNCVDGECVEDGMQMGTYSSCAECQADCGTGGSDPCDDITFDYDIDCIYIGPDMGVKTQCDCE